MKNIFASFLWTLVSVIGFNIFLYCAAIVPPSLTSFKEGFGLYPKSNLDYIRIKEGLFIGTTDADGRFGDYYTRQKPEGIIRVGLVGDSYVQGTDVMSSMHFRKVMEDRMNKGLSQKKYEVVNLGRNNFNIPYSYHYYKNFGNEFNIDYLLYFMEERDLNAESLNKLSTYYELKDGKLVENRDWEKSEMYKFLSSFEKNRILKYYSYIPSFNLLNRARQNLRVRGWKKVIFGKFSSLDLLFNKKSENYSHHDEDYWSGQTENKEPINDVTKRIIGELVKSNPPVTFVTRNYPVKVDRLEAYLNSLNASFFPLSDIFNGPFIKGTDINANYFKASNLYGGHFNHHGHRALGLYLAERMLKKINGKIKNG